MHGVIGAALFAVIDDVEAAFNLFLDDQRDGFAHSGHQLGVARTGCLVLGEQQLHDLRRARQAAGVGR